MQYPRRVRFRRAEIPRDNRREGLPREEFLEEVHDWTAVIPSPHQPLYAKRLVDLLGGSHSKFRVQSPIRTFLRSRYSISSKSPGCGSWASMAVDSMLRIVANASDC